MQVVGLSRAHESLTQYLLEVYVTSGCHCNSFSCEISMFSLGRQVSYVCIVLMYTVTIKLCGVLLSWFFVRVPGVKIPPRMPFARLHCLSLP